MIILIRWESCDPSIVGPSNWSLVAPDCSSDRQRQTPIDIQPTLTVLDETLPDISLIISDPQPDQKVTMVNNGHTGMPSETTH